MIDLGVSWLKLAVFAAATFILNWLCYSPAAPWFKAWARGVGMDPGKREMSEADKKGMPLLMGGALLSSILLSYGLQVLVRSVGARSFGEGLALGALAWLAFAVTQGLNSRFEGRKAAVILIGAGVNLVSYSLFAGLLAIWD